ncbi:hypothetical protein CVT91_18730 [Candidatus Atribacteria bacterium HGW-Atribacteria-1]|nr:MAG: hypothetical protein CVT91_18730 [Candidatus Atribacteria bacterium HGW-Atribacteria-1]
MKEEIKKVLEMLKEGKINDDEASELLAALRETKEEEETTPLSTKKKRFLKIRVTKGEKPQVNVTIPFSLVNWGLNLASKLGKNTVNIEGKEIPIDMDELNKAMNDPEFTGKIVDVEDEEEGKHIEIEIV